MKTIKVKETDGFKIVVGVGTLSIDPKATQMSSRKEIFELPEAVEMAAKSKKKYGHHQAAAKAKTIGKNQTEIKKTEEANKKTAEAAGNKDAANACFNKISECTADINKHEKKYKAEIGAAESVNDELKAMLPEFDKKQKDVKRNNPVFCIPGAGILVDRNLKFAAHDEAELESIELIPEGLTVEGLLNVWKNKGDNEQITIDCDIIDDFRGCQYFYHDGIKWISEPIIEKLGITKNTVVVNEFQDIAIEKSDLTQEQSEEIRLQNLTAEDKLAEFNQKKSDLAIQATAMEKELQFDGDVDYWNKAQEFYNTELDKLKLIYNQ